MQQTRNDTKYMQVSQLKTQNNQKSYVCDFDKNIFFKKKKCITGF